jgi:hypothetical protein
LPTPPLAEIASRQVVVGVSVATQYKKTPEDVGDLWYFLAALADKLARESRDAFYGDLGRLATEIIQKAILSAQPLLNTGVAAGLCAAAKSGQTR